MWEKRTDESIVNKYSYAKLTPESERIEVPQVSSALERKADEPFATLQLVTHTPAVWILNFRVRYTKSGRAFRHTATHSADSCSVTKGGRAFRHIATRDANSSNVDPNGWNPGASFFSITNTEKTTSLEIVFSLVTWR